MSNPLISCICVTRDELALPVECFESQTYPNLELVIVHENEQWKEDEGQIGRIRYVYSPLEPKKTLGELMNLGVDAAEGEFCIIWDSDDWYHPERVERQYKEAQRYRNKSIVLSRWNVFDHVEGKAYLSQERLWEGSLLAPKSLLQKHPYPAGAKGVDTRVIEAFTRHEGGIGTLDQPDLYVYSLHSNNTCGAQHGEYIKAFSTPLDDGYAELFRQRFQDPEYIFYDQGKRDVDAEEADHWRVADDSDSTPVEIEGGEAPVVELGILGTAEQTGAAAVVDIDESGDVDEGAEVLTAGSGAVVESTTESPVEADAVEGAS